MADIILDTDSTDIRAAAGSVSVNGNVPQATNSLLNDITGITFNKGDLIVHNGSNLIDIAVGTNGQVLSANSATGTGLEWVTPAVGGTVTSVTAGAGLAQAGTANDPIINVAAADSTITVNANDIAVAVGNVDHDSLLNFDANDHVDHSTVSVTAGNGLTGGGDLTTTRNFAVGAGTGITVNANDVAVNAAAVDHDSLLNFVADEHVAHSSVTLTAGLGLTGGGTIASNRTFNVGAGTGITVAADTVSTNDSEIVHDNLSGFVADEHIAHSSVTLTAGTGLSGGGTIASNRTFNLANTAVTPGSYTNADITVDAQGRLTAASNGVGGGGSFRGARAHNSSGSQSIANNTATVLTLNSELFDTDGFHSTSTNTGRLTIPSGVSTVQLSCQVSWSSNSTGIRRVIIAKNGSTSTNNGNGITIQNTVTGIQKLQQVFTGPISVAQNEYFEILVFQNSGGSLSVEKNGSIITWFAIEVLE